MHRLNRFARFSEDWISPLDQKRSFGLIASGFVDSRISPVWPSDLSECHVKHRRDDRLYRGALVFVTYKLGPLHRRVEYRIVEYIEPRYIQYESTENHPLAGGGRIYFRALYGDKSLCKWEGGYRVRSIFGYAALAWFKAYYERRFFKAIQDRFEVFGREKGGVPRKVRTG